MEWLNKAGKAISFLMNSDCIAHLLCLFQRRWLIWCFWVLPFKQRLQTSIQAPLVGNAESQPHSTVESGCILLMFSMTPVHLSGTNPSPGDSLFLPQFGMEEVTTSYSAWSALFQHCEIFHYWEGIWLIILKMFQRWFQKPQESQEVQLVHLAGAVGARLANCHHSFYGFKVRVVDSDIICSLVTHWVFGFCKEEIWKHIWKHLAHSRYWNR